MDTKKVNIHRVERIISTGLGGALLFESLRRFTPGKAALVIALFYRGISGHSYLYQVLNVSTTNSKKQSASEADNTIEIEHSITIGKSANDLYRFWSEPENLAQIMGDSAEVTQTNRDHMHWVIRSPFNQHIEWDTQIVEDRPNELVSWKSFDGAPLPNEGSICFRPAPADWGTEVTLRFCFDPPGGMIGNRVVKMLDIVPRMFVEKALRRFKSLVETGEIPTLTHNTAARKDAYVHSSIG